MRFQINQVVINIQSEWDISSTPRNSCNKSKKQIIYNCKLSPHRVACIIISYQKNKLACITTGPKFQVHHKFMSKVVEWADS